MCILARKELYFSIMKLRIKGNSIRIRLSKTEVEQLCTTGRVVETTHFGNNSFSYVLLKSETDTVLDASFNDGCITIIVPGSMIQGWYENNVVGFSHYKEIGNDEQLFLLIEKDFKCIDSEVMEDQSDNYENPLKTC